MKLILRLRYYTRLGESLHVTGNIPSLGNNDPSNALPMQYHSHDYWQAVLDLHAAAIPKEGLNYSYVFRDIDGSTNMDWGAGRLITAPMINPVETLILDSWNPPGYPENALYTQPFRDVLLKARDARAASAVPDAATHIFRIKAPGVRPDERVVLLGNVEALGYWDPARGVSMQAIAGDEYLTAHLDLGGALFPIEYKYAIVSASGVIRFESGSNRRVDEGGWNERRVILNDGFIRVPSIDWNGAGVAIPVFSLRSESSWGVGEFRDLQRLADWGAKAGLSLIQILPVNDTTAAHTWVDSYPYAAVSAFALHPLYLNLDEVATRSTRASLKEFAAERKRLNAMPAVDYEAVMTLKWTVIKRLFSLQKEATFRSSAYREFFKASEAWLVPYAVFCALRDEYGTADYRKWPKHRECSPATVADLSSQKSPRHDAVALHYFVQFHLDQQLQAAAAHAHQLGIVLKGDIAIGVARNGADTWQQPELFHLDRQAGAPPDPFAEKGQNWGFPTYNWPRMQEDGFAWWKQRFSQMSRYFDAFRIDHILGFFRIWSIPLDAVEGILGSFDPALSVEPAVFAARGIDYDRQRFVEPFINSVVLEEIFGSSANEVMREFLGRAGADRYALKPEFATQLRVRTHFEKIAANVENKKLEAGLFDLISNVILLEVATAAGPQLHFRFDMAKTSSFRQLDTATQAKLKDLYNDYFFQRQDAFWRDRAMQKLPALKRVTDMLICGEDLGLVPRSVPGVMKDLGLLSLEIQRMPKTPGVSFSRPADAPYLSVVTPSTHDMSTIRGWWTEDPALTQKFYREELQQEGGAPAECSPELNELVVRQHLASPAMWSIFQLQDLMGMDGTLRSADVDAERINIPANPKHYWRYRMHLTLEQLSEAEGFNAKLRGLLDDSGRLRRE